MISTQTFLQKGLGGLVAKKGNKVKNLGLVCDNCGIRPYVVRKNVQNTPEPLELKKFCPNCRAHTTMKETKKNLGRNEV